jgi:hypothetical protein
MAYSTNINDYTIKFTTDGYYWEIRDDNKAYQFTKFYTAPTGNCQLFSAVAFDILLDCFSSEKFIKELIHKTCKNILKNVLLLDINDKYTERVLKVFENESVIMNTTYTSTNGSLMRIILINTTYLR